MMYRRHDAPRPTKNAPRRAARRDGARSTMGRMSMYGRQGAPARGGIVNVVAAAARRRALYRFAAGHRGPVTTTPHDDDDDRPPSCCTGAEHARRRHAAADAFTARRAPAAGSRSTLAFRGLDFPPAGVFLRRECR